MLSARGSISLCSESLWHSCWHADCLGQYVRSLAADCLCALGFGLWSQYLETPVPGWGAWGFGVDEVSVSGWGWQVYFAAAGGAEVCFSLWCEAHHQFRELSRPGCQVVAGCMWGAEPWLLIPSPWPACPALRRQESARSRRGTGVSDEATADGALGWEMRRQTEAAHWQSCAAQTERLTVLVDQMSQGETLWMNSRASSTSRWYSLKVQRKNGNVKTAKVHLSVHWFC